MTLQAQRQEMTDLVEATRQAADETSHDIERVFEAATRARLERLLAHYRRMIEHWTQELSDLDRLEKRYH